MRNPGTLKYGEIGAALRWATRWAKAQPPFGFSHKVTQPNRDVCVRPLPKTEKTPTLCAPVPLSSRLPSES